MNTVGKFYMYNLSKQNQHLRDNQSVSNIPILTQYSQSAKIKHKPWRTATEQATRSITHTTSSTIIVYE